MIKHRTVIHHIMKHNMRTLYLTEADIDDIALNLTTTEIRLYNTIYYSVLRNPPVEYYSDASLASMLKLSTSSISSAKTGLKQKGYAQIIKFKDETGMQCLRVIVGKEQVELYNMGIKGEICNIKAYRKLMSQFKLNDPNLSSEDKVKQVVKFNDYYNTHKEDFQ